MIAPMRRPASRTFVGRAAELAVLEAALATAGDGEPGVVLVGGEAGVGKTRLLAELAAGAADRGVLVATGCVELTAGAAPYLAFSEALRDLTRSAPSATARRWPARRPGSEPSWPSTSAGSTTRGPPSATGSSGSATTPGSWPAWWPPGSRPRQLRPSGHAPRAAAARLRWPPPRAAACSRGSTSSPPEPISRVHAHRARRKRTVAARGDERL
jgi:hypothetical protein